MELIWLRLKIVNLLMPDDTWIEYPGTTWIASECSSNIG